MDYYESLSKEIFSRYETITSLTQQTKIKGDYTEAIVRDFIGRFLPQNFRVGHGLIYNSEIRKTSPECDVIVYDVGRSAPIFRSEDLVVVNSRYVRVSRLCENVNKSVDFLKHWTMRKSRYAEAEGGEFKLEACECFFRS